MIKVKDPSYLLFFNSFSLDKAALMARDAQNNTALDLLIGEGGYYWCCKAEGVTKNGILHNSNTYPKVRLMALLQKLRVPAKKAGW